MKLTSIVPLLAAATAVVAETHLAPFDSSEIKIGVDKEQSYELSWVTDKNDLLDLELVRQTRYGWKRVQWLFIGKHAPPPGGNYTWYTTQDLEPGSGYALFLSGRKFYDMTPWFSISKGD